ncbi:MAG: TetR family transcriptional regulator [Deltaproteobacteria bacterium]|nr:TetR family transcriptional regulator [Deltaproteobacteria bacterium]
MARQTVKNQEADRGSDSSPDVRERILDRTIYLMGKLGTTDVTVRAIAREAGVNVAAVNYYFSSKERMIALMADRFQAGFEAVMTQLADESVAPEQRLRDWAATVVGFLSEYPGVLTLMERQLAAQPLDAFGEILRATMQIAIQQLEAVLRELIGDEDEKRFSFKLTMFISTLAGPYPQKFDQRPKARGYRAPAQQAEFLNLLIEHLKR